MDKEILRSLRDMEQENDVKVLYACESGSRAWGFSSKDSDYDVRFFYVHRPDVYLSIDPVGVGKKRDVIERPIHDLLDVSGWDLTKALKLFRKSNPPLLEWLYSDIIYEETYGAAEQMRELSRNIFSPSSCIHHYTNMAANNYRAIDGKNEVKLKTYFNALRPVLAAKWIAQRQEIPPLSFHALLTQVVQDHDLFDAIQRLLEQKIAGDEGNKGLNIPVIDHFLETELKQLRLYADKLHYHHIDDPTEQLNQLFRRTLQEVWSY
ncbi:nucleotidyltransferase domain-containing protein [Domibacillus sp. A3M-37]|uniref:nucleotidyltransferase domain-containing protein n=1 Tax=Domibacillus sp. A3M-37 TaxID=2962037 RepID=UPI0020B86655|nr:nucleotidyltransferase domain-containing protein [Domibacillus sp. A3M-37]MCP3760991.1 nucleotidyltransferase domain-containing protein [Domibacillus sp. A3M-37]